jgi:hypothetical protein
MPDLQIQTYGAQSAGEPIIAHQVYDRKNDKQWFNAVLPKRVAQIFVYGTLMWPRKRKEIEAGEVQKVRNATVKGFRRYKIE